MTNRPNQWVPQSIPLTLRTLGGAGLYAPAESELLLSSGKPLALLIYLAFIPGRRTSRNFLIDLLWADLEPDNGRRALRQALFHLRRLLGEDALPGTEELALAIPVTADRDLFLAAIERGELESALELYTGTFLPTFGVPGGAGFERWADLERDRLRAAFLRSAELVVRRQLNLSRVREAQRLARRVRAEAPDSEAAWRLLLETVVAGRDFVSAAVEAQTLEQWALAEEIVLEPATRLAIARARQITPESSDTSGSFTLVAELIGREREFSIITAAWEAARTGPARHVHLEAAAGFGKSRLLRDAVARLRAAGVLVVEVRAAPGDRDIPYAFAADVALAIAALPGAAGIAPAVASTLIALNPALSSYLTGQPDTASRDDALRRRIHALTDLVHAVADEQPLVLAIDDVHWADTQSYQILIGLFGRLKNAQVLCLTAARPGRNPTEETATILPLSGLTRDQISALVSALGLIPYGEVWADTFATRMHAATRGSPLFILETLRLAIDDCILAIDNGEWRCLDDTRLAALLRSGEALRQRVRALHPEQMWLLALLATAGTPLSVEDLAVAATSSTHEITELLAALEKQGLVIRAGGAWLPAHDEISEVARDTLEAAQQAAAEQTIGELLIRSAGQDQQQLLRGVRHLIVGGEERLIQRHFRRYAQLARQKRDHRPFEQLAAELLRKDVADPSVKALVRTLPPTWRVGLWSSTRRRVAAVVALVVIGFVVTAMHLRGTRELALQRLFYLDSALVSSVIPVDAQDWDGRSTSLRPKRASTALAAAARAFLDLPPALSGDGRSAAWTQDSGDSTTLDIWLRTPAGTRRLTWQARDDVVNSWLPDGSALIGMTNRWSPREHGNYDIAVFDTATGAARRITHALNHEGMPFVSPDGTRIAFVRESENGPPHLCVIPFDAQGEADCRYPGGYPVSQLLGWSGPAELILTFDSAGARPLGRYDWQRDKLTTLIGPHVYGARLSPNRRWVVGALSAEGMRGFRDWIIPIDRPTQARPVDRPGGTRIRWWEGASDQSQLIQRIEFTDTTHTILPGIGTRFGIRALTGAGTEVRRYASVRWNSSDTLVATVDSMGDVFARTTGVVSITASLAGWRNTSRRLVVVGRPATTVLEEQWDDAWPSRWITFGDPKPLVIVGPGNARGFWNHGDGTYPSMAVLRRSFSAKHGLGLEVRLSTPVTRVEWQRARTMLVAGLDTTDFQRADQRKAPPSLGSPDAICGATYPAATGRYGESRIAVFAGMAALVDLGAVSERMRTGSWWTLRIQLLPDGRCGIAVENKVVWLSPESIPLDGEFRLRLGDESAGTRLLQGSLQVWTGVRTDIDWSSTHK